MSLGKRTFYRDRVGPKMRDMLDSIAENAENRVDLSEEIDASRAVLMRSMKIYEAAVLNGEGEDGKKVASPALKSAATIHLQTSLKHVADLVLQQAKTQRLNKELMHVDHLPWIITQVGLILKRAYGDDSRIDDVMSDIGKLKLPDRVDTAPVLKISLD